MLYAKIAVGLPIEGPFDYSLPCPLVPKIKIGARAWINFAGRRLLGYVVGLADRSAVRKVKPILALIDETPLLNKNGLALAEKISGYYCCSLGEAIEAIIPKALRQGRVIKIPLPLTARESAKKEPTLCLLHDLEGSGRWDYYLNRIKETLQRRMSVILVLPDLGSLRQAESLINKDFPGPSGVLYRNQPGELRMWERVRNSEFKIILGLRSAVFAPVDSPGLIIVDEEEQSVYKQDQVPHYHAREVALMRSRIDNSDLILGSLSPSLEGLYLAEKGKLQYLTIPRARRYPDVKLSDPGKMPYPERKRGAVLTRTMEEAIYTALNQKGRVLIFLNRKGFATYAHCSSCGTVFKCPRCNINLVYHFKEGSLRCHYCNYKMVLLNICPACNSGYVRLGGTGTEKIESEIARIFPQARITPVNDDGSFDKDADIFISTSAVLKEHGLKFDLIAVAGIDNSLNRIDFRASEKAYALLAGLANLTEERLIIQSRLGRHHSLAACINNDPRAFYEEELKERKRLNFPPYCHIALVKLRGRVEGKVKEAGSALFARLKEAKLPAGVRVLSLSPAVQAKLRGNYYWQVMLSAKSPERLSSFLKLHLKDFRRSGIIVTADMDPL